ncbi:MAG TPA: RNHCP domain-containing protein [Thermomicrobiales bacterium]|nr:RNHCP domain-containing protein [Thermomicrobiales bacterium]
MGKRPGVSPLARSRGWELDDDPELTGEYGDDGESMEPGRRQPRGPRSGRGGGLPKAARKQRREREAPLDPEDEWDDGLNQERERRERERRRAGISEPFKCRNCRAFIGMPPTGGQQRNHCPMCLYSLHVDDKTPGDRASDCRSLMEPIGVFYRRNMEQVLAHRCLGCGFVRFNRIAADDNPVLLDELPIVDPPDHAGDVHE